LVSAGCVEGPRITPARFAGEWSVRDIFGRESISAASALRAAGPEIKNDLGSRGRTIYESNLSQKLPRFLLIKPY
jgi:hypothetical protein